jgi:hypothetical protein
MWLVSLAFCAQMAQRHFQTISLRQKFGTHPNNADIAVLAIQHRLGKQH